MAYGTTLAALLAGPRPAMGQPPATLGTGSPPAMSGLPPAPTGIGAMPTGDPSTTRKAAADQAILALREAKGHYPSLAGMLDATVDALKAAASQQGAPGPMAGAPSPPGSPPAAPLDSGAPGGV